MLIAQRIRTCDVTAQHTVLGAIIAPNKWNVIGIQATRIMVDDGCERMVANQIAQNGGVGFVEWGGRGT
ncbi:hypothetical protein GCM10009007_07280 [Formosimonas limnophila]|uniref:Uncharacterized protein n=1 Tax=Formosimonas limnophila TaxID=1384487 RepID=A0A8J3CM74_9BURK|nr:hypothetical protein GCM10009007_07280 [Formosimonas limnophila]